MLLLYLIDHRRIDEMLSKKNVKLMIQKQQPRKQRFGIRKLSIGVVSVLLGLLFIGGGYSADADDQIGADALPATNVVSNVSASEQAVASAELASTAEVSNASSGNSITMASAVDSTAVNTPLPAEIPATSPAVPSSQPTAPVASAVLESAPVASAQPVDSAVPDTIPESQAPAVSDRLA